MRCPNEVIRAERYYYADEQLILGQYTYQICLNSEQNELLPTQGDFVYFVTSP